MRKPRANRIFYNLEDLIKSKRNARKATTVPLEIISIHERPIKNSNKDVHRPIIEEKIATIEADPCVTTFFVLS